MQRNQLTIRDNLIQSLKNGDEKTRLYAIGELENDYKAYLDEAAIPTLAIALIDSNGTIRSSAKDLLTHIRTDWKNSELLVDAVPPLVSKLKSTSNELSTDAARLLANIPDTSLPILITMLGQSDDEIMQWKIIQVILQIDSDTSIAIPQLLNVLDSNHSMVKELAIKALAKTGSFQTEIMSRLCDCLQDSNSSVRLAATEALANFEEKAAPVSAELVKQLLDAKEEIRTAAANGLAAIGEPVVGHLIELIEQRRDLRKLEIQRIQKAKGSLFKGTDLEKFLLEPYKAVRNVSWHFKDILDDLNKIEHGIVTGVKVLARLGPVAAQSVDVLEDALTEVNPQIRDQSVSTLGAIGSEAEKSLPVLLMLHKQIDFTNYESLIQSLNNIQPDWASRDDAQPLLQHLLLCLNNRDQKLMAILALKLLPPTVIQQLVEQNDHQVEIIDAEMMKLLVALGDNAMTALPFLNKIIQEEEQSALQRADAKPRIGFKK